MLVHCVSGFEGASLRAAGFFCFFRGKDGPLFAKTVSCSMSSASSMLGLERLYEEVVLIHVLLTNANR